MKYFIICLLLSIPSYAKTIRVAVIDSGLKKNHSVKLCPEGITDYTGNGPGDNIGHGTNISHIIHDINKEIDYCQIIYKVFDINVSSRDSFRYSIEALRDIKTKNVDIINYSAGGEFGNGEEKQLIKELLDKKVIFVAAAGNNNMEIDKNGKCFYFPACYDDRIVVVGSHDKDLKKSKFSNYGSAVDIFLMGEDISGGGYTFSGTSQSTALMTSYIVNFKHKRKPQSSKEETAYKKSAEAFYKQSGTEDFVKKQIKNKLSKNIQDFAEKTLPIIQIMYNQKIQYEWSFE